MMYLVCTSCNSSNSLSFQIQSKLFCIGPIINHVGKGEGGISCYHTSDFFNVHQRSACCLCPHSQYINIRYSDQWLSYFSDLRWAICESFFPRSTCSPSTTDCSWEWEDMTASRVAAISLLTAFASSKFFWRLLTWKYKVCR